MNSRCRPSMFSRVWLLLACCIALPAWSIGIGEWRSLSALGERAQAEAEILHTADEQVDISCFRLLYPGAGSEFPPLEDARLSLRNTPKGLRLRLESSRAVSEPITQIRLKLGCGSSQTRDMVLLFSPREYAQAALAESTQLIPSIDAVVPQAGGTAAAAEPGRSGEIPLRKPGDSKPAQASPGEVRPKKPASKPAPRQARQTAGSGEKPKLVLSSELDAEIVNRLRLSATLRQVPKEATAAEREQLRRLYRSMMQMADLKEGPTAAASLAGDLPADPNAAPALTEPPAGVDTATQPNAAVAPPPIGVDQPKATALAPLEPADTWWLPLLGLLLLALLLGLWLLRSRKARRPMPEPIEAMPPLHALSIKSEEPEEAPDTLENLLKKEMVEAPEPASPSGSAFANVRGVTVHSENPSFLTSYRTMLDLADSMMAFGLNNDAADALKEYVEDHPEVAVEPWLKLLDILRQTGKRADFDQYSFKLRQHFNLDLPGWDASPSLTGAADARGSDKENTDIEERFRAAPSPLEAFPHVRDRLVSMWGQADCVPFLQHLMRDNREGKRRGFPLIVVDDILLLLDMTKELTGIDMDAGTTERPEIFSDTW
jgi:pilus assembly protein FimV